MNRNVTRKPSKKGGKTYLKYAILILAAISLDFVVSHVADDLVTYKYESEFDAVTAATVKVGLVPSDYDGLENPSSRDADITYEQVEDMVRKAIDLQGGFDWVIDKGDNVMLKVNLVGANSPSGQGENTDVRVVKALIKIIDEFTEGDVEIVVAEGSARTNDDPESSSSVWANSGYTALKSDAYLNGINFRFLNLNQSIDDVVEVDLGDKGMSSIQGSVYGVHAAELQADVYIVVPVLKIHDTGITNALKLQVGTAPGCYYGYNKMAGTTHSPGLYHDVGFRRWTTEMIVDLCNIADIDFVVVDALMCLETYKTYKGDNQVRMNTIIAGVDPVAVDHVCAELMGLNPDDIAHITLAEKAGLGTNDPDKINVEGATISEVAKRVKKNTSENGKFGQSNRTWILSGPYEGTSIATEYIPGEASVKAVPGQDGWTQPVYFFDDRIDLSSFYSDQTNIVSYAYTNVYAPKAQEAELWLGAQEAIYVYLNSELVYSSTTTKTYGDNDIGSKVATVQLAKGENALMVKTLNRFGDYSFALNICEPETNSIYAGNRVKGLKFYQTSGSTPLQNITGEGKLKITLTPNPARDFVNISVAAEADEPVRIIITNLKGQTIKSFAGIRGSQTLNWDLQDETNRKIQAGTYLCIWESNGKRQTIKFMVK
ncbi:DUF362 domain-containing protein [Saccharicrinis sp. FJH54]|uniref:DUF362 domain-containing protein n=1 Tax=Saccharicrinis sp. FJH54 TaxID=3344665 RepID=UPI0035D4221B